MMDMAAILGMVRGRCNSHDFRYSNQQLVSEAVMNPVDVVLKWTGDVIHQLPQPSLVQWTSMCPFCNG